MVIQKPLTGNEPAAFGLLVIDMAKGHENLRPVRTKEEARERGRKGGIASGKARRKKRDMMETTKIFLEMAAKGNLKTQLEQLGVPVSEQTNMMAMVARAFTLAMAGDVNAMRFIRECLGKTALGTQDELGEQDDVTAAKIYLPDNGRD